MATMQSGIWSALLGSGVVLAALGHCLSAEGRGPTGRDRAQAAPATRKLIATAYCSCRQCCGPNARGITSTGKRARRGTIAVDPRIFPYGTRFDIAGYGRGIAEDTGGAMRRDGRRGIVHIDAWLPTHREALRFGRRKMTYRIVNGIVRVEK